MHKYYIMYKLYIGDCKWNFSHSFQWNIFCIGDFLGKKDFSYFDIKIDEKYTRQSDVFRSRFGLPIIFVKKINLEKVYFASIFL
jgi:hypothetical protein